MEAEDEDGRMCYSLFESRFCSRAGAGQEADYGLEEVSRCKTYGGRGYVLVGYDLLTLTSLW